ncbi:MAG: hypothetical protein KBB79_03305 [Candidatus Omnitrophica bacterium]|nr:hypothetical protein [Candidatus Omnitrophota bacterium]
MGYIKTAAKVACFAMIAALASQADAKTPDFGSVINRTANMTCDQDAIRLARQYGLNILNLTWEDTGRYKNSSVGPNISDMTIQVQQRDPYSGNYNLTCMPVIRFPNFSDRTGDVDLDKLYILVGNEKAEGLKRVSLREFLGDIRKYMSEPGSWKGSRRSLLAPRDSHVLVSAQACFLPIPREGTAEFNPVLFNYQSVEGDPAVLTILATREGTSITVIDNKRDGFNAGGVWGQRLFFNQNGERASLTGKRLSDYLNNNDEGYSANSRPDETEALNMVMLIQVPLKQKNPMRCGYVFDGCAPMVSYKYESALKCKEAGNVENAVIGHGRVEGPFTEIAGLDIERDPAYPIRVTVQFYKATSNGIVTEHDMKQMAEQIGKVYAKADYVGSLVVGGDTRRPTEYTGDKNKPCNWWREFWSRQVARPKWGLN